MKKGILAIILILSLFLIFTIGALEITINSPINNSVFSIKPLDSGIFIPANASTDENATCKVMPWDVNLSIIPSTDHFNNIFIINNNLTDYEMTFICNDTNNSVFEKSVNFYLNYSCTPNLLNTSWSDWEFYECGINDLGNQSRYLIQYDTENCVANQTIYEYQGMICNYCSQNIIGPFYNNWTECNDYGIRERIGRYTDLNFASCCNITDLPDDCEIKSTYGNFIEKETCDIPLNLYVNKPSKEVYESRRIEFDINSTLKLEFLEFIDFFENEWKTICRDCKKYEGDLIFNDGLHNLTIRGRTNGKEAFAFVSFFVDTKYPRISTMSPRGNKFTNGSFSVRYTEENCKSVLLEIFGFGGVGNKTAIREPCLSGRNKFEYFYLNLTDFNNQEISYQFAVYDISNKTRRSKFIKAKVDTTPPALNNLDFWEQDGRYIYFTFNVTEINLDKITSSYIDSRGRLRETRLCSRLRNGICEARKSFSEGDYDLSILIKDKAGNSISKQISFEVE